MLKTWIEYLVLTTIGALLWQNQNFDERKNTRAAHNRCFLQVELHQIRTSLVAALSPGTSILSCLRSRLGQDPHEHVSTLRVS
ncbi:hypothetical protein ES319_A06G046700v1 [Gossypium barbadense]|uniref:Secreted protein n=2 Tax=Gossypium TaxID=3633 RepID=A0A5J5V9W8_GOSBA|nr:hypothetical protein ES319_A06G046700v1 [Gossypium barbadense]TYH12222.1 hypothetical protein ES288_A06G049700v1 [Gossypium darwinii]